MSTTGGFGDRPLIPGPVREDCPCEDDRCGRYGVLQKRTGHVRNCACRKCLGGRNRRKGLAAQRKARKALGVPPAKVASILSNEEGWRGYFRAEVKSGAQVKPVLNAYLKVRAQSEVNKAEGDPRPFVGVFTDDLGRFKLMVVEGDAWEQHIAPRLTDV